MVFQNPLKEIMNATDSPLHAALSAGIAAKLLSHAYSAAVGARNFAYDSFHFLSQKSDRPVISVGGIRAGGTGKTPVTRLIARHLIDNCGCGVAVLSRGYGRVSGKNIIVRPGETADWRLTGDEPCMLRNDLPEIWLGIGADRSAMAGRLSPLMPERSVFILDDGFQRRQTRRDLDIVCTGEDALDGRLMPAGYLREPPEALSRADIVFVIGAQERIDKLRETGGRVERYLSTLRRRVGKPGPVTAVLLQYPDCWTNARSGDKAPRPPMDSPAAVVGIARPERFLSMLPQFSIVPSGVHKFPDHHIFKRNDFARVHNVYLQGVVTTEKDAVRLMSPEFSDIRDLWYLKIGLRFADEEAGARALSRVAETVAP
jgi:tetraacyldisaccharide 4'-kinase